MCSKGCVLVFVLPVTASHLVKFCAVVEDVQAAIIRRGPGVAGGAGSLISTLHRIARSTITVSTDSQIVKDY